MPIIPETKVEQLEFCESHWPIWLAAAPSVGLSISQVNLFKGLTVVARQQYDAAQAARQAARAATVSQNDALSSAVGGTGGASDLIRVIKAFAEMAPNPDAVYALAQIPPPAPPTPATAPGRPNNMSVTLLPTGAITLAWEATNSSAGSGGFFTVSRRLPGQPSFTVLGGAPGSTRESRTMSFTDSTVPTSAAGAGAQYIIQGQRGTLMGEPSDAVVVQFGVEGPGLTVTGAELKIAA